MHINIHDTLRTMHEISVGEDLLRACLVKGESEEVKK